MIQYILDQTEQVKKVAGKNKMERNMQMQNERINFMKENPRNVTSYNLSQKNRNNQYDQINQGYSYRDY